MVTKLHLKCILDLELSSSQELQQNYISSLTTFARQKREPARMAMRWACRTGAEAWHSGVDDVREGSLGMQGHMIGGACDVNWLAWRGAMHVGFTSCKKKERKAVCVGLVLE